MKTIGIIILVVACSIQSLRADNTIDSLEGALKNLRIQKVEAKEKSPSIKDSTIANVLFQLGKNYFPVNTGKAEEYLNECLRLSEQIGFKKGMALAENVLGYVYGDNGETSRALEITRRSLMHWEEIEDKKGIASVKNSLGNIYYRSGDYPEALKYYLASLKLKEEIGDKKGCITAYMNIGNIYKDENNYPDAISNYSASLRIARELNDKPGEAKVFHNLGIIYLAQKKYPEALSNFEYALGTKKETGDQKSMTSTIGAMGAIYFEQGNYAEALKYYKEALKIDESLKLKEGIIVINKDISDVFIKQNNYAAALLHLNKALEICDEMNSWKYNQLVYDKLSEVYGKMGDYKRSLENYKLFISARDSIFNDENSKKLLKSQIQFDYDKKESQLKSEQEKKDLLTNQKLLRQKILVFVLVIILLMMVVTGILLYSRNKLKAANELQRTELEKKQRILEERERIASELHDDLGSGLTKISLMSQVAGTIAGDKQQQTLKKINTESSEMVDKMNGIIWALNTKNDSLPNLISFIRKHAFALFENTSTRIEWNAPDDIPEVPVSGEVRRNIYMAVNESLHNTLKYSNADNVAVHLFHENEKLVIQVRDDGKGFNVSEMTGRGNGLTNIKKRMQEIGGETILVSEVSKGTSVTFIYPIAGYTNV